MVIRKYSDHQESVSLDSSALLLPQLGSHILVVAHDHFKLISSQLRNHGDIACFVPHNSSKNPRSDNYRKSVGLLWNASSCTVRQTKWNVRVWSKRKVNCRAKQGKWVAHVQKSQTPWWFLRRNFSRQNLEWGLQGVWHSSDCLMVR